jgi:hypothetical protein
MNEDEVNPFRPTRQLRRDPVVPQPQSEQLEQTSDQETQPVRGKVEETGEEPLEEPVIVPSAEAATEQATEPVTEAAIEAATELRTTRSGAVWSPLRIPTATDAGIVENEASEVESRPAMDAELIPPSTAPIEAEPDLPPTPTERGIEDPVAMAPPSGIHNTPSKRTRRQGKVRSSPLKSREERPKETRDVQEPEQHIKATFPVRHKDQDKYAAKRQLRDQLLQELGMLKSDVEIAERESTRLYNHMESNSENPFEPDTAVLLPVLERAIDSSSTATKEVSNPKTLHSIASLLPFASRRKMKEAPPIPDTAPANHHPLPQENPLPFLQLFTPLTFTSTVVLLPQIEPATPEYLPPALQKHTITISHPLRLFSARTSLVVNADTLTIESLNIDKLDPRAEAEVSSWAAEKARKKDASALFWGLGRYAEISLKRAKVWCAIEKDFADGIKNVNRGKKRRRRAAEESDNEEEAPEKKWTRRELAAQIGRTSMLLQGDGAEIWVEWKIGFDWTGEVESAISAFAKVPANCKSPFRRH